mgnify:CR=1 FL=1
MLLELRDVEVHIEPVEVLTQALQDYDLSVNDTINICIDEESVDTVLEAIENEDIKAYCYNKDINIELNYFPQICEAVKEFTTQEKAMLLWQLLKDESC